MGGPAHVDGHSIEEFDNFEYTPFVYEGKEYISAEQAYQASKFTDERYKELIRKTPQAHRIWELGQTREFEMKPDFDRVKEMTKILWAKIAYNKKFVKLLISTKGEITFPESDTFWGTNEGYGGENQLGKILMKMRDVLKA
jgi:hypothetical protein